MLNKRNQIMTFKKVCTPDDVEFLYHLLIARKYTISHESIPSMEDHSCFVLNHPYRFWNLILQDDTPIGSFYIGEDNSIAIDLLYSSKKLYCIIIKLVLSKYKPLPAIKSVRSSSFIFNISPSNKTLKASLILLGMKHIQSTFVAI